MKIDFIIFVIQKKIAKALSSFIISKKARRRFHKNAMILIAKRYLKKYLYAIDGFEIKDNGKIPKVIWVCWLQGVENAPKLVQDCIESVKQHANGYKVNVITNENINQFVEIPQYIYEKKALGYISNTHFSDILRVFLLAKHGGVWVDATVFLTAPLPKQITSNSFFCLHTQNSLINNVNWIIASCENNTLTSAIKELLLEYWKNEKTAIHYFIFQILFDLMVENNKHLQMLWQNVPVLCDSDFYGFPSSNPLTKQKNMYKMDYRISDVDKLLIKTLSEYAANTIHNA